MKNLIFLFLLFPLTCIAQTDGKSSTIFDAFKKTRKNKSNSSKLRHSSNLDIQTKPDFYKLGRGGRYIKKGSRKILAGLIIPALVYGIDYNYTRGNPNQGTGNRTTLYQLTGVIGVSLNLWGFYQISKGGRLIEESQAHILK